MRVFLSSTYQDLAVHRAAVSNALERLGQQVGRMEIFGARPAEPLLACLNDIDSSDLFVGVYAHRYGFVPEGARVSITEIEYEHAKARGKPLFCFLVRDDCEWPKAYVEDEPGRSMLRAFKSRLRASRVIDFFNEPLDLAVKAATAVGHYLIQHPTLSALPPKDSNERSQRNALIALLQTKKEQILDLLSRP